MKIEFEVIYKLVIFVHSRYLGGNEISRQFRDEKDSSFE